MMGTVQFSKKPEKGIGGEQKQDGIEDWLKSKVMADYYQNIWSLFC